MANRNEIFGPTGYVLAAGETINLGDVCEGKVGRILLSIHDESSMNTLVIIPKGFAASVSSTVTKQEVAYVNANAPDTVSTADITAVGNYLIEASGMAIDLVCTIVSGSARLFCRRVVG